MNIEIYDKNNIDDLKIVDKYDNLVIKQYSLPLIKNGLLNHLDNIDAEMQLLCVEENVFPIVISNLKPKVKNSYVCSATTHYLDYAKDEINMELADQKMLKTFSGYAIDFFKFFFEKMDFEKTVFVNNLLLSTNLYPDLDLNVLEKTLAFLIKKFPDYPIMFKSVNKEFNTNIMNKLESLDCVRIFSRQVYVLDPKLEEYKQKNNYYNDLRLTKKTKYIWEEIKSPENIDLTRIKDLYRFLYIDKYSQMNPQFNEKFFLETIGNPMFTYKLLKKDNVICGVLGYFNRNNTITAPIVGYDTSIDQKDGLYRLIIFEMMQDSIKNNWILNMSSGVSKYKMMRGAVGTTEYNMVYYKHLKKTQQIPWFIFEKLTKNVIEVVAKKYQL
ncbi:MAG: hypothetical protein AABZ74_14300 [Cyanobacteriota bacterium]